MQGMIEKRGSIGIIWIDNPPVNAISHAVREGLIKAVENASKDSEIKGLVLACRGRTFMAGADITEFASGVKQPWLGEVIDTMSESSKVIVAAIFGTTFGGGLEVALGCNYRIADSNTKIGLPEVKLGIIPGAQGTQRLSRVSSVEFALKLATLGNPVGAQEALEAGAIDKISNGELIDDAVSYAEELLKNNAPLKKSHTLSIDPKKYSDSFFNDYRKTISRKTRGMAAPECCIKAIQASVNLPFEEGVKFEREMTIECRDNPQSKALQHVFFAERQAAKVPGLSKDTPLQTIKKVGVIGAGTMGGGISMNFANVGIPVKILEMDQAALDKGLGIVKKNYEASAWKGRISSEDVDVRMGLIEGTTDYSYLKDVDLVIEAVFENMDVKKEVFSKLNETVSENTILASNTSYLDIDEIATVVDNPERVLGMHFFSPANIMRLLEIVIPGKVADDVVATGFHLAKRMKKVPVRAGNCDGFIGNRVLENYAKAANYMMEDGTSPYAIDKAIVEFGYPMGPFQMFDLAGGDIGWADRKRKAAFRSNEERYVTIADRICEKGWFGQKTGRGYYKYTPGARRGEEDPEVLSIIEEERKARNVEAKSLSSDEIRRRYFAAMVNEGAKVLEEKMALRPSDIDVTKLFGYGFPRHMGGPMRYADVYGVENILNDLKEFEKEDPYFWKPAELIVKLVADGKNFNSLN